MMLPLARAALLEMVVTEYRSSGAAIRPSQMWVREYEQRDFLPLKTWPHQVWLLSGEGLQERNIPEWRRFEVNYHRNLARRPQVIRKGELPDVGFAAFSPTQAQDVFYLKIVMDEGLGRGCRVKFDENWIAENTLVWMS